MQIEFKDFEDHAEMQVDGRIDATNAALFDAEAAKAVISSSLPLLVDMGSVNYISSAGLRSLLKTAKLCKAQGRALVFFSMRPEVFEVCRISGFTSILSIVADRAAALEKI